MYAWFIRTGFEKLEIADIGRAVPISRLNLDEYNLLTVHT
ncbi:hypothetical protein L557_0178 [Bordetella pertussis STO1-CNMC-0004]|nr:hypothetical protein L557_0178 [Bordetella pertussis STO1-CNMC-0004]